MKAQQHLLVAHIQLHSPYATRCTSQMSKSPTLDDQDYIPRGRTQRQPSSFETQDMTLEMETLAISTLCQDSTKSQDQDSLSDSSGDASHGELEMDSHYSDSVASTSTSPHRVEESLMSRSLDSLEDAGSPHRRAYSSMLANQQPYGPAHFSEEHYAAFCRPHLFPSTNDHTYLAQQNISFAPVAPTIDNEKSRESTNTTPADLPTVPTAKTLMHLVICDDMRKKRIQSRLLYNNCLIERPNSGIRRKERRWLSAYSGRNQSQSRHSGISNSVLPSRR